MKQNRVTNAVKTTGRGLFTGLTLIADASTRVRIHEIDAQIKTLQEERDRLNDTLTHGKI